MTTFKDKTGAAWSIELPIGTVLRIKRESNDRFNLFDPTPLMDKLIGDELEFWELLWHLVEPQAKQQQPAVSAEMFGERLAADCLFEARRLFFLEWTDFFRQLHRPDRAATVEKIAQYLDQAMQLTTQKLASPEMGQLDQQITLKMQRTLNDSFGELQASLASIPVPLPGEN